MNRPRLLLALGGLALLAAAGLLTRDAARGQAAVSMSRPGQEDISFWAHHRGLVEFEVEGEVGFGDLARVLMRRRSNGPAIQALRDRFRFKSEDVETLRLDEVYQAEVRAQGPVFKHVPGGPLVAGSSRTVNLPLLIRNTLPEAVTVQAAYRGQSMASNSGAVRLAAGATAAIILRAVETSLGSVAGTVSIEAQGARAEARAGFDVRALARLRAKIEDETGAPVVARVYLTGSDGLAYVPRGSVARFTAMSAEAFFHAEGGFATSLPSGLTRVEVARGTEYALASEQVDLPAGGEREITIRLRRWTHRNAAGEFSADVHIHANYTSPHHQVIEPEDVRLQVLGEDLNYANMMVANSGGAFIHDRQWFTGGPHALSAPGYLIYWNEENRSSAYGHMCFLGLKRLVEPFYNGFRDTPHWDDYPANHPLSQEVFDQGGAVSYAHPGMVPAFEQASIKEMPVDLALGQPVALDVLSNNDENATTEMWYRLLNCGFRVPISAGTDAFTNVADHYLAGANRVYVRTGAPFDYSRWIDGFRRGRSFATNGPVAELWVEKARPGDEIRLGGPGRVAVRGVVESPVPLDTVDLVINGRVVKGVAAGGRQRIELAHSLAVEGSAWIALRGLGPRHRLILNDTQTFVHTSPVYVTVSGRPVRVKEDLAFYRQWVEKLIARTRTTPRFANEQRRAEVLALFERGLAWYQRAENE
ncbi:MAG: hypothetical protein FJW40_05720 [Acidobacteria bacterium]|nr:hypothetical protein [Acidobacteriota bacterium]